jgi:hypothetical protein
VEQTWFEEERRGARAAGLLNIKTNNMAINQIYFTVKYI